jgi:hypothetical protein
VIWRNDGATVSFLRDLVVDDDPLRPCVDFELAVGINERGEIAAHGMDFCEFDATDAYRLVPVKPSR